MKLSLKNNWPLRDSLARSASQHWETFYPLTDSLVGSLVGSLVIALIEARRSPWNSLEETSGRTRRITQDTPMKSLKNLFDNTGYIPLHDALWDAFSDLLGGSLHGALRGSVVGALFRRRR